MWDTLTLTYESLEVKRNKLSLLARKYELFETEENESIQAMFGRFQTIVNELSFLCKTYDSFDHIDKLLRSLPKKWRPQVIALRASKNLEKLSLEELIRLLKVHELELQQDDAGRKQKSIALNVQKTKSTPSSSKALRADDTSDESCSEETYDTEDEISFLSRKIHSMMKKKGGIRWRKYSKPPREKAQPLCYDCKKPGNYKTECPELEKEKEKEKEKKKLIPYKRKKAMMATWEDLDTTSSEGDEEANIYLMEDIDSSKSDNEGVIESEFKILEHAYNQLLSNSAKISTAYKDQKKRSLELLKENLLLKNENAKLLSTSEEVIKLNKEIDLLKSDLSKFTLGTKNLELLLKHSRSGNDRTRLGYVESESEIKTRTYASPLYGKNGHFTSKYNHMHKKGDSKTSRANTHGPKSIKVPKTEIECMLQICSTKTKNAQSWYLDCGC
ncbi:uncharacterized protein LOC109794455 [Cajanus cajan]|uniref:uncharacterized protein LOC109794455 n=1 Tax=Cajanus cajan TaxID=3821 RepID=UPI00098D83ED|nr:uncharacterized protein LOC109794455 [Cajanus cajan]